MKTDDNVKLQQEPKPSRAKKRLAMIQAGGFRCLAYRDSEGHWRDAFHDSLLAGPVVALGD